MSLTIACIDQSNPGPSGPITAWAWDFGDSETSTDQSPLHTYASPGTYTVSLEVTGTGGDGTSSASHMVTVAADSLTSAFGTSSVSGPAPLTVDFVDHSVAGPSGPITGWAWTFGDGGTSTSQNPSHTYNAAGSYTAELIVTGTAPDGTDNATKGIVVSASPAPPSPPGGGTLGDMLLNYGHLSSFSAHIPTYAYVVGNAWTAGDTAQTSTCAGRGLSYFNFSVVQTSWSTGVPYAQASANNWLLRDSNGNLMVNSFGAYLADVGSTGYQQAWIANVLSYLAGHSGIDGIFIDAVNYDPKGLGNGSYPASYPSTTTWSAATVACLKAIYAAMSAHSKYVMVNASAWKSGDSTFSDGTSTIAWWNRCAPYTDGLCNEFYAETNNGTSQLRANGTAWYQNWTGWQRIIGTAQGAGCDFLGLHYNGASNTTAMQYGKASFLLEWGGAGGAFGYCAGSGPASSTDPTNIAWTRDIGTPSAAKVAAGSGWIRHYTGGVVCVNPSATASQAFSLGGSFLDDSAVSHSSVTLAPTTAQILHT